MTRLQNRRAFLLLALAAWPASAARAQPAAAPHAATRPGRRPLDLRLDRDALRPEPSPLEAAPVEPPAGPEVAPRAGLSVEFRPQRRARDGEAATEAAAAERDPLAEGLGRLGLEEVVIRLLRPL